MASVNISLDDLHAYHAIDREIFTRLVITLARDPAESLLVMSTWLWLEERGYPNIVQKMVNLVDPVVNSLAGEAASALKTLEINTNSSDIPYNPLPYQYPLILPLTSSVMGCNLSLSMFLQNKYTAISGIKNFLVTICSRIFTDILQVALGTRTGTRVVLGGGGLPLTVPGFPHPLFGCVTILPRAICDNEFPPGGLWGWSPSKSATEDERTMFLTFSRGFPVTEQEVRDLFNGDYGGNCVVGVQMQEINIGCCGGSEQPLFAKMLLDSVETVDKILKGERVAKFRINGKHIWARKYERRD